MEDIEGRFPEVEDVLEYFADLQPREAQAFLMVGQGLSNKEIASEMGVSVLTVRTWLKRVYGKLYLRGRGRLAVAASRLMDHFST